MIDPLAILFALVSAVITIVYLKDSWRGIKGFAPLIASVATGAVIVLLLGNILGEVSVFFVLDFALLFAILPFYYARDTGKLLLFLAVTIVIFAYATIVYGTLLYQFIEMFAIGTGYGIFYRSGLQAFKRKHTKISRKTEIRRDYVHILLGIVIFAMFLLLSFYAATLITISFIFLGYIYNSLLGAKRKGKLFGLLSSFEREESLYGLGALYLAVGMALLLGFVHDLHFVLIGVAALFFADPAATIVGLNSNGPKLPHSKKKSWFGTLAFFAVVSIIGFPFIGFYSLLFGAALAFVESLDIIVDDNISIPIVMIILYIILLASLNQLPFTLLLQHIWA